MAKTKNGIRRMRAGRVIAASLLLLLSSAFMAHGQTAPNKETFAAFWTRFKAALAKNDRQAIAAMTKHCKCGQTPFETDKLFLDEWYATLRRNRACLERAKPIAAQGKRQSYSIICRKDDDELVFERIGGEWKFINVNIAP